jgi:trigger factor
MSPGSELNELARGASFTFSVDIEVIPDFTMPAWEGIAIRKPVIDVVDKHIDDEVLRNQYRFGTPSLIEGPFEHLDRMIGTVAVTVKGEAEPFYKADNALAVVPAKEDEGKGPFLGIMIDDLQKYLMGRKVGDAVSFTAKGPEGHEHEKVRGNDLSFSYTITQAERITPAPVAELATKLGLADEAMLREQVKMVLEQRRDGEQQVAMREQVMEHLADAVDFELPAKLSAGQITRDLERQRYEMLSRGTPAEQVEVKLAEARAGTTEGAQRRLKLFFILQRLAEEMRVDVTEGELNGRVAMIARQQNMRPAELRKELEQSGRIQEVALGIREAKVADRVIARATVTDVPAEAWNKEVEAKAATRKAGKKA